MLYEVITSRSVLARATTAEGDLVLTQGAGNVGALARTLADLQLNIEQMKLTAVPA